MNYLIFLRLNAFTRDMYLTLPLLLDDATVNESVRAVVITGRGKYYSSGNDLSMFKGAMEPGGMKKARCLDRNFVVELFY